MAPSRTKGAVTRLLRNAAMNVTVFQFPCSTFWTSRSPCGARPYRRVIVVDTLVSSMNTSLLGSSLFCRRCNALRAAATSGRSCSAARKLFFKGQLQMMQKPRDRRLSDRDLFLLQSVLEFGQRDVRLLRYQLPHQILVRRQREIFVAAEFGRVDAARLPVKLEEADDRTDADPALLRGFRDRGPALDRLDHTPTQIRRIWLRHSCRPPPSRKLESYSRRYGNPRFSLSGKRSNRRLQPLRYAPFPDGRPGTPSFPPDWAYRSQDRGWRRATLRKSRALSSPGKQGCCSCPCAIPRRRVARSAAPCCAPLRAHPSGRACRQRARTGQPPGRDRA